MNAEEHQLYTDHAVEAVTAAVLEEHDFGGWLAEVLCTAAAALGSSYALIAGRPDSWEAALIDGLVRGTAGHGDEFLGEYRR